MERLKLNLDNNNKEIIIKPVRKLVQIKQIAQIKKLNQIDLIKLSRFMIIIKLLKDSNYNFIYVVVFITK